MENAGHTYVVFIFTCRILNESKNQVFVVIESVKEKIVAPKGEVLLGENHHICRCDAQIGSLVLKGMNYFIEVLKKLPFVLM